MSKLLERMQKEVDKRCEAYHDDLKTDVRFFLREKRVPMEYFWIVKKAGTELVPVHLALMKNSHWNDVCYLNSSDKENKVYRINVSENDGVSFDGDIKEVRKFEEYLNKNSKTPMGLELTYNLHDGTSGVESVPWNLDYFENLCEKVGVRRGDVEGYIITDVIY